MIILGAFYDIFYALSYLSIWIDSIPIEWDLSWYGTDFNLDIFILEIF